MEKKRQYQLDIVGKFYSALMTSKWAPTFRCTAVLTEIVEPHVLSMALGTILPRFPYFTVTIKKGLLWPSFVESDRLITSEDDKDIPFASIGRNEPPLRIRYHDRRVSVEMQHVLADGYGAMVFLKTLLAQYYILKGIPVPISHGIVDIQGSPVPEEYEDSYLRYHRKNTYFHDKKSQAYHVGGKSLSKTNTNYLVGVMDTRDVLRQAHMHNVSITEYLAAMLSQSIHMQQLSENPRKYLPIRISITADMRKFYATKTLRNFSQYSNPSIDFGKQEYSFEKTLSLIKEQCRVMFTQENLRARMNDNVRCIQIITPVPSFIKRAVIVMIHRRIGDRAFTTNLSNMGVVELPEVLKSYVERFETMGSNFRYIKLECGVISFNGVMSITFSSAMNLCHVQDRFFDLLSQNGIPIKIESNVR